MGPGGGAIADAVSKSTSIPMLDISFNSICGNGKIELPKDEEEEKDVEVVVAAGLTSFSPPLYAFGFRSLYYFATIVNSCFVNKKERKKQRERRVKTWVGNNTGESETAAERETVF